MENQDFHRRLIERERELADEIARLQGDARESRVAEVEDPIDQVTSSEVKAATFEEIDLLSRTLAHVRAALQRIKNGTYGKCLDCGKDIEPARLKAVPWTPYCRADQEAHDRADSVEAALPR